jgi:hypothetical protein
MTPTASAASPVDIATVAMILLDARRQLVLGRLS